MSLVPPVHFALLKASEIRDKLGLSDPDRNAELLHAPSAQAAPAALDQPSQALIRALQATQAELAANYITAKAKRPRPKPGHVVQHDGVKASI